MNLSVSITSSDIMLIIVVLAAIGTYQFFKGRKLNIMLMYFTMKEVEKVLNPIDKTYTLLGMYVGYTAIYDLEGSIKKVEVTVTLLPRQSILYFPISLLTSRFDKIFVRYIFPEKITREAHIIAKHYYRLGISREIVGFNKMIKRNIKIKGKDFILLYKSGNIMRMLEDFVKSLKNPGIIKHVAVVPANKSLYIAMKLDPESIKEVFEKSYSLAIKLTKNFQYY